MSENKEKCSGSHFVLRSAASGGAEIAGAPTVPLKYSLLITQINEQSPDFHSDSYPGWKALREAKIMY